MPTLCSPGRMPGRTLTSVALLLQFPAFSTSPAPLGSSCRPTTQRTMATTSTASGSSWPGLRAASTWLSTTSMWSLSLTSWSSRMGPRPRPPSWAPFQETSSLPPSQAVATWPVSNSRPTTPPERGASTSPLPVSPHSVSRGPPLRVLAPEYCGGCPKRGALMWVGQFQGLGGVAGPQHGAPP